MRAVRSQVPQDRRARSDAPYQPDKMRIAAVIRLVFAFPQWLWCIEGLSRPMAKRPCQRNSTLIEYGTDD
jgi:hypothetical protein